MLAFGGIFIVVSICIRMQNGEWLRRAGPFEVSESLGEVLGEVEEWRQVALTSQEEVIGLRKRLEESEGLVHDLQNLQ